MTEHAPALQAVLGSRNRSLHCLVSGNILEEASHSQSGFEGKIILPEKQLFSEEMDIEQSGVQHSCH